MAVGRKSAISAQNTWFDRSARPEEATLNASTPPKRKRRNSPKPTATPSSGKLGKQQPNKQQSAVSKNTNNNQEVFQGHPRATSLKKGKIPTSNVQEPKTPDRGVVLPLKSNSESTPLWLLRFYAIHRHSSIVAFLLVAATLIVYGWTVYSQDLWSQSYSKLQNLRRQDRQLTTTNEVLQNKMAVDAERPAAGLAATTPADTIFLRPAPHNPNAMSSTTIPNSQPQPQQNSPLGY